MWKLTIPGHMENERWIPEHDTELGKLIQSLKTIAGILMIPAIVIGGIIIWIVGITALWAVVFSIISVIISTVMPIVEWATPIIIDFLKRYGL